MLLPQLDLRRYLWLVAAGLAAGAIGCQPAEQITKYSVPKPELIDPTLTAAAAEPAAPAVQMLGVIVPMGQQSWFFKLTGDPAAVEPARAAFASFVKAVKFSAASEPTWNLPEGWRSLPAKQFGFATVGFDSAGQKLEIAVSSAGGELLTNVNRWRGQVGLPPIGENALPAETEEIQVDGHPAKLVSLVGTSSRGGMVAPFAGASKPVSPPPAQGPALPGAPPAGAAVSAGPPRGGGDLAYDVPKEWKPVANDAISLAAFEAAQGEQRVKITITSAGGPLLANVNRWRGQVGLPGWSPEELVAGTKKIETLGVTGDYVEAAGPQDTILGVQATAGGATWFFKLRGSPELATREKSRFEAFVKSVKFK